MRILEIALASALAISSAAHGTSAQVVVTAPSYGITGPYGYRAAYPVRPFYGYPAYYRSGTTAAESYARGAAAMLLAQGHYNRLTAEARAINAETYAKELENRKQRAETLFAMREANRQARAAERRSAPSAAALAAQLPKRLGADRLDAATGTIQWPELLRAGVFAEHRSQLDEAFSLRASSGVLMADEVAQTQQTARAMLEELRAHVREVSPMEYVEARSFLESLAYEAQLPAGKATS